MMCKNLCCGLCVPLFCIVCLLEAGLESNVSVHSICLTFPKNPQLNSIWLCLGLMMCCLPVPGIALENAYLLMLKNLKGNQGKK